MRSRKMVRDIATHIYGWLSSHSPVLPLQKKRQDGWLLLISHDCNASPLDLRQYPFGTVQRRGNIFSLHLPVNLRRDLRHRSPRSTHISDGSVNKAAFTPLSEASQWRSMFSLLLTFSLNANVHWCAQRNRFTIGFLDFKVIDDVWVVCSHPEAILRGVS